MTTIFYNVQLININGKTEKIIYPAFELASGCKLDKELLNKLTELNKTISKYTFPSSLKAKRITKLQRNSLYKKLGKALPVKTLQEVYAEAQDELNYIKTSYQGIIFDDVEIVDCVSNK